MSKSVRRSSFDEMYDRYRERVFRQARSLLRDPDRAQDATQEVFLRAAQHPIEASAQQLPWLVRVTKNLCLNHLRDRRRRGELLAAWIPASDAASESDARLAWSQLFAHLPEELHEIAISYYVDELSHQEIAVLHGVSRRTIGNRIAALHALAAELFTPGTTRA